MCKNVLPAYNSAKIIFKNLTSFSRVMTTDVLPRFFYESQCTVQYYPGEPVPEETLTHPPS